MKWIFLTILLTICSLAFSQKHPVEKVWYNQEKTSKILVFKATDGKYYGKIVWLKEPKDGQGKPRTDIENPDKNKRNTPLLEMLIVRGFSPTADDKNVLDGGKIYDPKSGKTYCGKMTLHNGKLDLRGFICSMSILGRTSTWTPAE